MFIVIYFHLNLRNFDLNNSMQCIISYGDVILNLTSGTKRSIKIGENKPRELPVETRNTTWKVPNKTHTLLLHSAYSNSKSNIQFPVPHCPCS